MDLIVLKRSIVAFMLLLCLDFVWISLMFRMYDTCIRGVQMGVKMQVDMFAACLTYFVIFLSLIFLFEHIGSNDCVHGALFSSMFGFFVYSIFNLTNKSMFQQYTWQVSILDTIWGTSLYFVVVFLSMVVIRK